jgi:hypothetical protein
VKQHAASDRRVGVGDVVVVVVQGRHAQVQAAEQGCERDVGEIDMTTRVAQLLPHIVKPKV